MKKFKTMIIIIFSLPWTFSTTFASNSCTNIFSIEAGFRSRSNANESLIAYLGTLFEQRIISQDEFSKFAADLEKGELSNPIELERAQVSSAALLQREEIQKYLESAALDRLKLLDWVKKFLQEKERVQASREETRIDTQELPDVQPNPDSLDWEMLQQLLQQHPELVNIVRAPW